MTLQVLDANGAKQNLSTTNDETGAALVSSTCLADPATGKKANTITLNADGQAITANNALNAAAAPILYNGTSFDRARGNVDTAALVTLTTASASGNSADIVNHNARGVNLVIDITALAGTAPTLTVTIKGKDAASGKYYTLLASVALNTVSTTLLTVYPGAPATANASTPLPLPRTFRIEYAIGGTSPEVTATIGASLIV